MPNSAKAQLLARLATARAGLFCQLLALGEDALTTQPIAANWTAKDILAHVAAWDRLHANRVAEIAADRTDRVQLTGDRDALNADFYAERRDWELDRVLDDVRSSRAFFLAQLEPLTWDDIARERAVPGARPMAVLFLAQRRADHDLLHIRDIQAWREQAHPARGPGPKTLLVDALGAGHRALLDWHEVIPPEDRSVRPVCGSWSWQQVLGHLADWEHFFVQGLEEMASSRPAGADFDGDDEAWNRRHASARESEPFEKTWEDFIGARWQLLDHLNAMDDEALRRPADTRIDWLARVYDWFSASALHDCEHAENMASSSGLA